METMSATDVRKNWSETFDNVVREKPAFIKRTRDNVCMLNMNVLAELLSEYSFSASKYVEDDGSITLSEDNLDIIINADNETDARISLANDIKEYAEDFYNEFAFWSAAPNRKPHIPYVLKALILTPEEISEELICHDGKN